jgi:hypothetical protein
MNPPSTRDEYPSLRRQMSASTTELSLVEIASVVATAAVFAWIAINAELLVGFAGLVWFAPVVLAIFGALKARAIRGRIAASAEALGEPRANGRRWAAALAWLLFVGLTFGACGLGFMQFRSECGGPLWNVCGQDDGGDEGQDEPPDALKQGTSDTTTRGRSL